MSAAVLVTGPTGKVGRRLVRFSRAGFDRTLRAARERRR